MHTTFTSRVTVCSLILRFIVLFLIGLAINAIRSSDGGTVNVMKDYGLSKSCFIILHSLRTSVSAVTVEGPSASVEVAKISFSGESDGPCDLWDSEADVVNEWKASEAYCKKKSGCPGYQDDAAEQGWCSIYSWENDGTDFEYSCDFPHSGQAVSAALVYSILLLVKFVLFYLEYKNKSWTERAENKTTKAMFYLSQWWLLSYVPGIVMAPVTSAYTYEEHEIIETRFSEPLLVFTMTIGFLLGVGFLIMSVAGAGLEGVTTGEDSGCCRKMVANTGWMLTLGPLMAGMASHISMSIAYWDLPVLNLHLIFSFSLKFTIAIAIDLAQIILSVAMFVDLVANVYLAIVAKTADTAEEAARGDAA